MTRAEDCCTTDGGARCADCPPEVVAFREQLGLDDTPEPIEGELLPAPDPQRVFRLGYSVGRSSVEAEAAADRVFRRARSRRLLREATAVGVAWLVGSALGEWIR